MKEKILIVEDAPQLPDSWKTVITQQGDDCTEVLIARSYEEVERFGKLGDIAYCLLDLGLPPTTGGDPVGESDGTCGLGFHALELICSLNPYVEVSILSRWSDGDRTAGLLARAARKYRGQVKRIVNKNEDGENYISYVLPDVVGLKDVKPYLDSLNIRAFHPLERRIVRRLWWKASINVVQWPTPIIVLRGESRAGKDWWARAFVEFRNVQCPNSNRVNPSQFDLGQLGGPMSGEAGKTELFGCRNFQGVTDCAGVFERATAYQTQGRRVTGRLAGAGDTVDFSASSTALLSEFGNIPHECQQLLLQVLDPNPARGGRVIPAGGGNTPIPIGCCFAFTTNAEIEDRIAPSDHVNPGEFREDLYNRLPSFDEWIFVPTFFNMGFDTLMLHLNEALRSSEGEGVEIAASTEALLKQAFDSRDPGITMARINNVVDNYNKQGGGRLRPDSVLSILTRSSRNLSAQIPATVTLLTACWAIADFEREGIVVRTDKAYHILDLMLRKLNEPLRIDEHVQHLNQSPELSTIREQKKWKAATQKTARKAVSDLRGKVNQPDLVARSGIQIPKGSYGAISVAAGSGDRHCRAHRQCAPGLEGARL